MLIEILTAIIIITLIAISVFGFFTLQKNKKAREYLVKKEEEAEQKIYKIAVLNKISEKMDYSLNVQSAVEIIIESLRDFTDYTSVSYMLLFPEKIIFGTYLEKPVSHKFVREIKTKMLGSLSSLLNTNFSNKEIEEKLWGPDLNDELKKAVESYFDIPLEISGKVVGLLSAANEKPNAYGQKEMTTLYEIAQQTTQAVTKLQGVIESEKSKMNAMVFSMTEGVIMTDTDYKIAIAKAVAIVIKNGLFVLGIETVDRI